MLEDTPLSPDIAQETIIETLVRPDPLALRRAYPAITVIGAGIIGGSLLDALAREHAGTNTAFARAVPAGSMNTRQEENVGFHKVDIFQATRFRDSDLVVILASADDAVALEMSGTIAHAAQRAGAPVMAMLTCEDAARPVDRHALATALQYCVDALVVLPAALRASVLRSVLDAYTHAAAPSHTAGFGPVVPVGADFLDVTATFADCTGARIGIGHSNEIDRACQAANRAMMMTGLRDVRQASGLLVLIAGSRALRLREVADAVETVLRCVAEEARMSLGVHYDNRLGDVLRVTLIAASGKRSGREGG